MTDLEPTALENNPDPASESEHETVSTAPTGARPALTIVVQSWMTPIIAILMLVLGLVAGFFGRPLLVRDTAPVVVAQPSVSTEQSAAITDQSPDAVEIMQLVSDQTRHFTGDEDAPVTMIEFSDFQ